MTLFFPEQAHLSRRPSSCSSLPPLQQLQRIPLYIHNPSQCFPGSAHCSDQALAGKEYLHEWCSAM